MAPRYLLDTNICIYIRRRRPREVLNRFLSLEAGEATVSVITYGELAFGAAKLHPLPYRATEQLQEFVEFVRVLPLPIEAGGLYGELRALLEMKGEMIGNNDLWIAAHALSANLTVVTNNEREFHRVLNL